MLRPLPPARRAAVVAALAVATLLTPAVVASADTVPAPATTTSVPAQTTATAPAGATSTTTSVPAPTTTTSTAANPSTTTGVTAPATATATRTAPATATATGTTSAPAAKPAATSSATTSAAKAEPFSAGAARTAATTKQAGYAAGFIARTLAARGDHYTYPGSTFADLGNTIDGILGLDGAGAGLTEADKATDYLAAHVADYIGSGGETYAGPTAKLLIAVVAQGGDPSDFGGEDLVTTLSGLEAANGRFSDQSQFGDYSNTIGQALAVIALGRATGSVPGNAVDYLLAQQCRDGGFRGALGAATCVSDPDATGFAAQALIGALDAGDPAIDKALNRLAALQATSGGIAADGAPVNANTTGVAAQAFAAAGRRVELAKAQAFLISLQYGCTFPPALRGGIAYTATDFATRAKSGSKAVALDSDLRATPQATLGLAGESLLTVTADGAADGAPTQTCTSTPSTTTPTTPTTTTTTTTTTTAGSGGQTTTTPPAGSGGQTTSPAPVVVPVSTGPLANTGAQVAPLLWLAVLLVLAGAIALVSTRRRGAHS